MNQALYTARIIASCVAVVIVLYWIYTAAGLYRGVRKFNRRPQLLPALTGFAALCPVLLGVLLLPFAGTPVVFSGALGSLFKNTDAVITVGIMAGSYVLFSLTAFFPHKNKYYNLAAPLILLSAVPSITNASIIFIINLFIGNDSLSAPFMAFYFALNVYLFAYTTKKVKVWSLIISENVTADLNGKIISEVFLSGFERFEKKQKGSLFMVLGDYVNQISNFSSNLVALYTNLLTVLAVMIYLLFSNAAGAVIVFSVVAVILSLHYFMGLKTAVFFNNAAKVRSQYMNRLLGVVNGFKELSLHELKRRLYRQEVQQLSADYTALNHAAAKKYINRVMISDMAFIVSIGFTCFAFPVIFGTSKQQLVGYVLAALFLWGPINVIIRAIPEIVSVKTSLRRIRQFISNDISNGSNISLGTARVQIPDVKPEAASVTGKLIDRIEARDIYFEYESDEKSGEQYYIGPVDFSAKRGEITFLIGGNGSGKTTLAKLLCGLYTPQDGVVLVDGKTPPKGQLGEYFSVIFSDFHLFRKVYTDRDVSPEEFDKLAGTMKLDGKVSFTEREFSTIDLSRGQSKRLAIIQCMMEDRPVLLLDECAADQDPEFKIYFYRHLLPALRDMGKILIVITHDDVFFDVADKIYKMDSGKIETIKTVLQEDKVELYG
jgi:putative pyoverdin transport system ATP-binding/permease protein